MKRKERPVLIAKEYFRMAPMAAWRSVKTTEPESFGLPFIKV